MRSPRGAVASEVIVYCVENHRTPGWGHSILVSVSKGVHLGRARRERGGKREHAAAAAANHDWGSIDGRAAPPRACGLTLAAQRPVRAGASTSARAHDRARTTDEGCVADPLPRGRPLFRYQTRSSIARDLGCRLIVLHGCVAETVCSVRERASLLLPLESARPPGAAARAASSSSSSSSLAVRASHLPLCTVSNTPRSQRHAFNS